ncbi:uncharacterized protein UTRI_03734_B [Ustilago trichophora]|uniref:Uncharacterized protein n=1 Tax=Ustilago trichophora TaxID=86804 RepID=A0A5C3DZ91_9BASI|nr:uncharacterized protein UTRI_03734_B [Ustilago trichophora]
MYTSLGAVPPRHRHCFQHIPSSGSASSSETTSTDPMYSTSSTSSHTSTSNTIVNNHTKYSPKQSHQQQQPVASTNSHRSSHTEASTDYNDIASSSTHPTTSDDHIDPAGSRFDSLHELLERAGYKETRVVTPDRQTLAGMFAKKLATPPRKTRLVDDFSSDSPSLAASELRRAVQRSRSTPKAATSKSLPSRNYKLTASPDSDSGSVPPPPDAPAPSSSWWPNVWLFGPGTILNDPAPAFAAESSPEQVQAQPASPQSSEAQAGSSSTQASTTSPSASEPASTSTSVVVSASTSSTRPIPPNTKRTASNNPVWTASVAYRSSKSRTAPVRKNAAISSDVMSSDAAAEDEWKALANNTAKRRLGLVDAFTSPTKKAAPSEVRNPQDSPSRQRKWKKERAAWRESLGDLQAMMDQSRLRREAAAAAVAAAATTAIVTDSIDSDLPCTPPSQADSLPLTKQNNDEDAVTKLLSGPALPFLSTDPAVAPRNGSCTRPTHLSMRRMKSVEVLSKIIRERRTVSSSNPAASSSSSTTPSVELDTESGQISPTLKKRSTPPRLTVSSPRGISSPKELALEGHEFEPMSWSPGKSGAVIISNRRVQKKPRSKLRHVSSGSDLRSAAAEQALKMPKRGRSKIRSSPSSSSSSSSPNTSPRSQVENRGPVAAILRDSVGSLSRGAKVQALRRNIHVFDESELSSAIESGGRGGVDDSPTRMRSRCRAQQGQPLVLTHAQAAEVDDVFRPSPSPNATATMMRKKDFSARITRTSKIMRLIEEAENTPSIASMISNVPSATARKPLQRVEAVPQSITRMRDAGNDNGSHGKEEKNHGLSSSLSRKSKERMHTITRVLGQRQPVAN